jgi:hypothetical protein
LAQSAAVGSPCLIADNIDTVSNQGSQRLDEYGVDVFIAQVHNSIT